MLKVLSYPDYYSFIFQICRNLMVYLMLKKKKNEYLFILIIINFLFVYKKNFIN